MPVVRNAQFYFREGFCWSDINTTFLKCRVKPKSVHDVKSMSLFGMIDKVPEYYIISIINSTFMSLFVDNFVNNTQTFQINDARQLPIIVPSEEQLNRCKAIYEKAIDIKKKQFSLTISEDIANEMLKIIQNELDDFVLDLYGV